MAVTGHTASANGATLVAFGEGEEIETDLVVVSVGRSPYTRGCSPTGTGVKISERGFIDVDDTVPHR